MVHDAGVAGTEFDRADVARAIARDRDHEGAEDVGAVRGYRVLLRHADDEIGRAELPAAVPQRRRRRRSAALPSGAPSTIQRWSRSSSRVGEAALALERALPRLRFPRRHDPPRRHRRDLRGMAFHIVVGEQAEGPDLPRPMTRRAAVPDDRRDVPVERRLRLRGRSRSARAGKTKYEVRSTIAGSASALRLVALPVLSSSHVR